MNINIDPELKTLIPNLTPEEYQSLETSIKAEGCRDALILWNDTIVDGHNRYEICTKHNITFNTTQKEFNTIAEVKEWIINNQFGRRNINEYQRADLANKLEDVYKAKAKENQVVRKGNQAGTTLANSPKLIIHINTRKEIAKIAGIGESTMYQVKKIQEKASDDVKQKLNQGKVTINKVFTEIKKAEKKQEKINQLNEASKTFSSDNIKSYYGDFYEFSKGLDDNSLDCIITDPPYPEEYLPLWEKLFEVSYQKLKPSKFLVAYSGEQHLDKIFRLHNDLIYYWMFKLDFSTTQLVMGRNIISTWKPVLVFQKPPFKKIEDTISDKVDEITKFNYDDRTLHNENWGQAIGNFEYLIDKFTQPGDLIFEPFTGTGTTLVAAQRLKRKCIGVELDEMTYKSIIEGRLVNNQ